MEMMRNWSVITSVFKRSFFYAVATTQQDGSPHVTPLGAFYLRDDGTGYYFEIFTRQARANVEANPRICVLAVDTRLTFWLKALLKGRFPSPPAVRLTGVALERREAAPSEVAWWHRRTRRFRLLKGYSLLWGHLSHVREVRFDGVQPVHLGRMTAGQWP